MLKEKDERAERKGSQDGIGLIMAVKQAFGQNKKPFEPDVCDCNFFNRLFSHQ